MPLLYYITMRCFLVFEKSGDAIEFETIANQDLLTYFIGQATDQNKNSFSDNGVIHRECNRLLNELNWAVGKTNEVLFPLYGKTFEQNDNFLDCLDQKFLNKQHEQWVFSQRHVVDIDALRFSNNTDQAYIGNKLHDCYPDEVRKIRLAEAMTKLGYIFPYEEVNMTVHRLEAFFSRHIEFKSQYKWDVFDNPYQSSMVSNNDVVNLSFGYTYVGRQYYDKWKNFDSVLEFQDHYNYEQLEWAFQLNLNRPETITFSEEFLSWCKSNNVRPITTQIPLANIVDLDKNLKKYRAVLYKNSRDSNQAKLVI